jgi:HSP90 family molecular chaperone
MGIYEDDANRSKLAKLLRYPTTKSEGKEISFAKYIENMTEKQDQI